MGRVHGKRCRGRKGDGHRHKHHRRRAGRCRNGRSNKGKQRGTRGPKGGAPCGSPTIPTEDQILEDQPIGSSLPEIVAFLMSELKTGEEETKQLVTKALQRGVREHVFRCDRGLYTLTEFDRPASWVGDDEPPEPRAGGNNSGPGATGVGPAGKTKQRISEPVTSSTKTKSANANPEEENDQSEESDDNESGGYSGDDSSVDSVESSVRRSRSRIRRKRRKVGNVRGCEKRNARKRKEH